MAHKIWWTDFSAPDFDKIDPMWTIAHPPTAAVEQHGPHLPVGTDTILNQGCLDLLVERAPADLDIRILPIQSVGKSNEHVWARRHGDAMTATIRRSMRGRTRAVGESGGDQEGGVRQLAWRQ